MQDIASLPAPHPTLSRRERAILRTGKHVRVEAACASPLLLGEG